MTYLISEAVLEKVMIQTILDHRYQKVNISNEQDLLINF
jgi:hypothetical protein